MHRHNIHSSSGAWETPACVECAVLTRSACRGMWCRVVWDSGALAVTVAAVAFSLSGLFVKLIEDLRPEMPVFEVSARIRLHTLDSAIQCRIGCPALIMMRRHIRKLAA